jgi:hypothetical protein
MSRSTVSYCRNDTATELERARAHLRLRQQMLYMARVSNFHEFDVPEYQNMVLAGHAA